MGDEGRVLSIPRVDMASPAAAVQLASGLSEIGFVQLDNHGTSPAAAQSLRSACDSFFALPDDHKQLTVNPDPLANRGWRSRGSEALRYSLGEASPPDLFESFNCGHDNRVAVVDPEPLISATRWPDAVPELRSAAQAWLSEMEQLSQRLDALVAECIGLDLIAMSNRGPDTMACIDYRPGPGGVEMTVDGQQRMGAHTDYTTFTILLADAVPGLQIVGADGAWVDVIAEPGSLLMNVGDLLAMLTNDLWPSTLHRVVPMSAGAAANRRSVAYFHYPNLDVVVEPLSSFVDDGRPSRYGPVSVEAHLRSKLGAPKNYAPATSGSTVAQRSV